MSILIPALAVVGFFLAMVGYFSPDPRMHRAAIVLLGGALVLAVAPWAR